MDTRQQKSSEVSSDEWYTPQWVIASMIFMRHRVRFIRPDGSVGHPFFGSCLVAWGKRNDRILRECGIEGKYVVLNGD